MATDLGKVGMVTKGEYNSASTYEALDVVTYNDALYIAKQNVPVNTAPTNTTYWQEAISGNLFWNTTHPTIQLAEGITKAETDNWNRCYKIGKLIILQYVITIASDLAAWSMIMAIKNQILENNVITVIPICQYTGNNVAVYAQNSGSDITILSRVGISAGKYIINTVLVTP